MCLRIKSETSAPIGLLQPLEIPTTPWTDVSLDFVEGLLKSQRYEVILVVVDRLTKYSHFVPISHPYSTTKVASLYMHYIFKLHCMPASIVSDRDATFTSLFWSELFRMQGTNLAMSTAYLPQSDGQTEIVNRSLEQYLRAFTSDSPHKWAEWLLSRCYRRWGKSLASWICLLKTKSILFLFFIFSCFMFEIEAWIVS